MANENANENASVVKFRNPKEFISYYSDKLKDELEVYDIQVNKLGFVGFLLNLLGHTNFDAKQYYDSLFKESMVATSQETENLYFHSATYGYLPTFSMPSKATGNIVFDFSFLPKMLPGVYKREVIIGADEDITFMNEDYPFITKSKYKFIQTLNGNYSVIITKSNGKVIQIPSAVSEIKAPFQDVEQYSNKTFNFTLPNYRFGTYYPYIIEIDDGHISDIKVQIKLKNSNSLKSYDVKYVKYFEESFSKTVFLRKLTSKKFIIEFGSGIRGAFTPLAEVIVKVKATKGKRGNLNKQMSIYPNNYLTIINYYDESNGNLVESLPTKPAQNLVKLDFNYSENGDDPLNGDDLRNDVVAYIQTFDMLMTRTDFYNIAEKFIKDFRFIFKKSNIEENIFYLTRVLRDKFQIVCPSFNHSIKRIDILSQVNNVNTTVLSTGKIEPEIISYNIAPSDCFNNGSAINITDVDLSTNKEEIATIHTYKFESDNDEVLCNTSGGYDILNVGDNIYPTGYNTDYIFEVIEKLDDYKIRINTIPLIDYEGTIYKYTNASVQLDWDETENANKYIIIKSINGEFYYCETLVNMIIDDGTNFVPMTLPLNSDLVFKPTIMHNGVKMISPFLYQFNTFMGWYDGFIINESFTVEFSEMVNTGAINFDIPVVYFSIEYDHLLKKTSIFLRSHQDINGYTFKVTISEKSIYNEELIQVDDNNYVIEYTDNDGLLWEEFQIELFASEGTSNFFQGSTYEINQIYKINDELRLLLFDYHVYSDVNVLDYTDQYIINIPFMDYNMYIEDPEYYLDKVKQFIIDDNIPGYRMISDNLQFRVLDTIAINAYYLENFTVQKYTDFDIFFPLQLSIEIIIDEERVKKDKINLADKKTEFLIMVSDWLQQQKTGTQISFYNSQVVDLIHTDQNWIKSVSVVITDKNETIIPNGIETILEETGLKNIKDDKLGIVKFIPWYWHWDIDNLSIKMIFN